jgi:hypothetical protein
VTVEVRVKGVRMYRNKMTLEMSELDGIGRKLSLKGNQLN